MPAFVGTCQTFCPPGEAKIRATSGGVSEMEDLAFDSPWPLIKLFSRSAAGAIVETCDVRPSAVLVRVVEHVLFRVVARKGWCAAAAFAADRLRAARVDAYMQELSGGAWARALVTQLRFHAALAYALIRVTECEAVPNGICSTCPSANCGVASIFSTTDNDLRTDETGNDAWAALRDEARREALGGGGEGEGESEGVGGGGGGWRLGRGEGTRRLQGIPFPVAHKRTRTRV